MPKDKVKLILNLCLIAAAAIPRGGVITVTTGEAGDDPSEHSLRVKVLAKGANAKLASQVPNLLAGNTDGNPVDAQGIQPFYAGLVAKAANMALTVTLESDLVAIEALSVVPATVKVVA